MSSRLLSALQRHPKLSRPRRRAVNAPQLPAIGVSDAPDYPEGDIVPLLRMSGRWLEEHGFGVEAEVYVEASQVD
jgi:hypothetical protein